MLSRQSNRRQSALSGEGEETIIRKQDTITRRYEPSAEAQNPVRLAFISWLLVVIGIMAAGLSSLSCAPGGYSGPVEPIIVAYSPFESTALIWIAEDQKFFNRNGLEVTLRKYDSGAGSLNGVLNGEADITLGVTEFPMARRAFEKSEVRIIAAVAKSEQLYLVGRKDRGIEKMSDLKGKRIGTTFGTIAEFYLGRFLELNGMSIRDITVVDLKTPAEWENAVAEGVVDAIVTAQPYADLATRHLSDNAIVWPAQGNQYIYGLVVSSAEWVTKHTDIAGKFLKALAQAEEFASRNPAEAKAIVQKGLNLDASFVESAWSRDQFALSLDQSLITAMEDQARWIISNNLTAEKQVPNFLDYIDETALKAVKPGAVSIIR